MKNEDCFRRHGGCFRKNGNCFRHCGNAGRRAGRCMAMVCVAVAALTACNPEDRSGEQPFAPTVKTIAAERVGDSCRMEGQVVLSPNSRVTQRGFRYGNDTLQVDTLSADTTDRFAATTRRLGPGRYYVVAYASNGMGLSLGDTLYVTID
ncbi:MAG TPA: hypothetical protein IAC71_06400 [Candidatus Caccomonas pullistercoris]|nr:hypothetical protein [Candidatus Caccomonas pullistercoris]